MGAKRDSRWCGPVLIPHGKCSWGEKSRILRSCIGRASAATLASTIMWRWLRIIKIWELQLKAHIKQRPSIIDRRSCSRKECNYPAGFISFKAHLTRQQLQVGEILQTRVVAASTSESSWIEVLALTMANRYSQWRQPSSTRLVGPPARQSLWCLVKDWAKAKRIIKSIYTMKTWAGWERSRKVKVRDIYHRTWQKRRRLKRSSCIIWNKWMSRKLKIGNRLRGHRHTGSSSCWEF